MGKSKTMQRLTAIMLSVIMIVGMTPVSVAAQQFETQEDLAWNETEAESWAENDDLLGSAVATFVLKNLASGALTSIGGYGMDRALEEIFGSETSNVIFAFDETRDEIRGLKAEIENLSAKLDLVTLKNDLNSYAVFVNNYVGVYEKFCVSRKDYADDDEQTNYFLTNLYSGKDLNYMVEGKSVINATLTLGNWLTTAFPGNYNVFGAFDKMDRFINRWEHQGYAQRQAFRNSAIYTYALFSSMSQLACQTVLDNNPGDDVASKNLRIEAKGWLKLLKENAVKVNEMNERCAVMEHPELRIYRDTKKGIDLYVFRKTVEKGYMYTEKDPEWTRYTKTWDQFLSEEFIFPMARTSKFNRNKSVHSTIFYSQQPSIEMYRLIYKDYQADNGGKAVALYDIFFGANNGAFTRPSDVPTNASFTTHAYTWEESPYKAPRCTWATDVVNSQVQSQKRTLIDVQFHPNGDLYKINSHLVESFYSPIYYYGAVEQGKLMLPGEEPTPDPADTISGMASYYELPHAGPVILSVEAKAGYTYQWYVNTGNGYQELPSEIGASYTLPELIADMNGYQYICAFIEETGAGGFSGLIYKAGEDLATPTDATSRETIPSMNEPNVEADIHIGEGGESSATAAEDVSTPNDSPGVEIAPSIGEPGEVVEELSAPVDEADTEAAASISEIREASSFTVEKGSLLADESEEAPSEDPLAGYLFTAPVTLRLTGVGVPVPETVHDIGSAEDLEAALERVSEGDWDGHTLRLKTSIEYRQLITLLLGRYLTIDLNGYTLTVAPTAAVEPNIDPMGSVPAIAAIYVGNGSVLKIIGGTKNGGLNVVAGEGVAYGVYAIEGSSAQVSSVALGGGGTAVYAANNGYVWITGGLRANGEDAVGAKCVDGGSISVEGDVTVSGAFSCGAYMASSNGITSGITVDGNIVVTGSNSRGAYLDTEAATLTVNGNVTVTAGIGGISAGQGEVTVHGNVTAPEYAVDAWKGASVNVQGNAVSTGKDAVAVSSFGARLQIGGNITSSGGGGTGIAAAWEPTDSALGAQVTVDGIISAAIPLRIGGLTVEESDHVESPSKPGYYTFIDGINIVWAKPASFVVPIFYTLTVNANGGTASGGGQYLQGTKVPISAGSKSGYSFNGWRSDNGGSFAEQNNSSTIFNMPAGNVTVTANWHLNSGSSGGGSSSVASTNTPAITSLEKKPNQPVTVTVPVTATAGANGTASAAVPDKAMTDAIAKAQADAKRQGQAANGISVALNVTMPQGATSLTVTLTQNFLNSLVNAGVTSLEINGAPVSLGLDLAALREIQNQSGGNISISIAPVTGLSAQAKALIGNRPVYNITISTVKDGKTVNVTSLGNGTATLSIPYTPSQNEAVGCLFGVYVDGNGKPARIDGSAYDANAEAILLPTGHFSVYGVGYTAPSAKFTDIGAHWGQKSIDYVVGRGLLSGTTETTFAPNTAMTRGMLVTALGRLAGVDTKAYPTNSFTDVKADSVFRPYIEWAYKKNVVHGIGNQQFAPDREITREEIAVIFANYAQATGYTLPVTREATGYADASSIGSVYKTAVTAMQQAGIMMGGTDNKFNPKASATRAEVSAMLHHYVKLTIDPATAQGWVLNDAGQYLYYKDGKALTGTQTIDGIKYFFDTNGVLKTGWVKDGDNWHYYSGNSILVGFRNIGANGNNKTYYFTKDGNMESGKWLEINSKWYYFNADGSLARSTKIDGYEVDSHGVRKN